MNRDNHGGDFKSFNIGRFVLSRKVSLYINGIIRDVGNNLESGLKS